MATVEGAPAPGSRTAADPAAGPRTIGEAIGQYWALPVFMGLLLAIAGGVLGYIREPTYTAKTQLNAGSVEAQAQAIPGYVEASKSLADAYSRTVRSRAVLVPLSNDLRQSATDLASKVSASPVPDSSVFTIEATGASARAAVDLANAATMEINRYANQQARRGPDRGLLDQYRNLTKRASRLDSRADAARREFRRTDTLASRERVADLSSEAETVRLEAQGLQQAYVTRTSASQGAGGVTVLSTAADATSDRREKTQLWALGGLVIGLFVGGATGTMLTARRRRLATSLQRAGTGQSSFPEL
jgi:hypothetical protein